MKNKDPNDNMIVIIISLILILVSTIGYSVYSTNKEFNRTYTTQATIKMYR